MSTPPTTTAEPARASPLRRFARFELQRLLGKSARTMAWGVFDPRTERDAVLLLPRMPPVGAAALEASVGRVRRAARLDHPGLARPLEVDVHEGWPYALYALGEQATLADRLGPAGCGAAEAAELAIAWLEALAFVHEAGLAHRDPQLWSVLTNDRGVLQVLGCEMALATDDGPSTSLRSQGQLAQADVLQFGVVLHMLLAGAPALEEPDPAAVVARIPPLGREFVRLPFGTTRPVPEALRVIVNRATDRHERQRYRNARTLARALDGWLQAEASNEGGPLALVLDRIRSAGVLPASPGAQERAARLAMMERGRTDELAEVLLDDVALTFELLRAVNTAQLRSGLVAGGGAVLTVRRSIAMLGLDGVRRVALGLRAWPGPLGERRADDLVRELARARRAGRLAMAIRPRGYDAEVVYLVALLQSLGRLVVHYHFPEEAAQIRRLMRPPVPGVDEPEALGMSEATASLAVLGVELQAIGHAVARWWGLDESILSMMRRQSPEAPVHGSADDDLLRATASCAHEALDAQALPARQSAHALHQVAVRYSRALGLQAKDLQAALQASVHPSDLELPMATETVMSAWLGDVPVADARSAAAGGRM